MTPVVSRPGVRLAECRVPSRSHCRRRVNADPLSTDENEPLCLTLWRVMAVEDWAEIRRLHRSEGMAIKAIARRLRISRNAVRRALAKDCPPQCSRPPKGSVVDAAEPRIRGLLAETPAMSATVIAGRIGCQHGLTVLKVRMLRPC